MTHYRNALTAAQFDLEPTQNDYNDVVTLGRRLQAQAMNRAIGRMTDAARRFIHRESR